MPVIEFWAKLFKLQIRGCTVNSEREPELNCVGFYIAFSLADKSQSRFCDLRLPRDARLPMQTAEPTARQCRQYSM